MHVVIDIDENVYTRLFDNGEEINEADRKAIETAIRKGAPLPKGHGRLIDASSKIEIDTAETTLEWIVGETTKKEYTIDHLIEKAGCEVQTIIEADKGGEEENE